MQQRSSWEITLSVWYALFLRELLSRLFARRYAWFWLIVEPMMYVVVMIGLRSFIRVLDSVAGVEVIPWMVIGLSSFFMFRDGMTKAMGSLAGNQGLFAYRQIKPIDAVLVRVFTEGIIHLIVLTIFLFGLFMLGFDMTPQNLLQVFGAWLTLWFLGLGVGLVLSVAVKTVEELRKLVNVATLPMMILSGAFLPISYMPYEIQQYLLWNPILHALELMRLGYFDGYWSLQGINYGYLFYWVLGTLFLGVAMHIRFEKKLKVQ